MESTQEDDSSALQQSAGFWSPTVERWCDRWKLLEICTGDQNETAQLESTPDLHHQALTRTSDRWCDRWKLLEICTGDQNETAQLDSTPHTHHQALTRTNQKNRKGCASLVCTSARSNDVVYRTSLVSTLECCRLHCRRHVSLLGLAGRLRKRLPSTNQTLTWKAPRRTTAVRCSNQEGDFWRSALEIKTRQRS